MNRKCTLPDFSNKSSRKRRLVDDEANESEEETDDDSSSGVELVVSSHGFRPMFLMSEWQEPRTMTKCLSIAIVLPSGVEAGGFCARVVESGEFVELVVRWPAPLVDPELLHRKWIASNQGGDHIEAYHPKIVGFQNALKSLRKQASDNVESTVRIPLPFAVQTHIDAKYNLAWRDSTVRIVYLELKAILETYAVMKDSDQFEVV